MRNLWLALAIGVSGPLWGFPNVCDVVNTSFFEREVDLKVRYRWCPMPFPHPGYPCADVSYNLPKYFIEVVNNTKETMFAKLPGVAVQLSSMSKGLPFGTDDDSGAYSYHGHVLNIPFTQAAFAAMPCGGGMQDLFCFAAASEHLGSNWRTGFADMWQPKYKAWALSPKACLMAGVATSATGDWATTGGEISMMCSNSLLGNLKHYPPSTAPVCTAWGFHFPRTGTVTSSDTTTASLMIASRIKSIGGEVFRSVASNSTDKWQMMYPHVTTTFREGQSIAYLRSLLVNEHGRLTGKLDKFLYATWQGRSCTVNAARAAVSHIWIPAIKAACKAIQ